MNCERIPGPAVALMLARCKNTKPLDLLAASRVVRSLKVKSLKGPLPRTAHGGHHQCITDVTENKTCSETTLLICWIFLNRFFCSTRFPLISVPKESPFATWDIWLKICLLKVNYCFPEWHKCQWDTYSRLSIKRFQSFTLLPGHASEMQKHRCVFDDI